MKSKGKLDKTINSFYHLPKSLLSLPLLYGRILHKDNRVAGWRWPLFYIRMGVMRMGKGKDDKNLFDVKDLMAFGMFILALLTFIYMICH